jgi:hypothetical protein
MASPIKKHLWSNAPLKVISLILGYTFWYIFGNSHTSTAWVTVPLCFYNVATTQTVHAPETISLKIAGKRSDLRALDPEQLAIHINAEQLHSGRNLITLTDEALFLPNSIKLVHYTPSNPTVEILPLNEQL